MGKVYGIIVVIAVLVLIVGIVAIILLNSNPMVASQTPNSTITPTPNQTPIASTPATSSTAPPSSTVTPNNAVTAYSYQIVNSYPHDSSAFTEGLLVEDDDTLLESTGLTGASSLRRVSLTNGQIIQQYDLSSAYFGEGLTVVGDKVLQLTWKNGVGFIYDKETFDVLGNFSLNTEGWGLTYDGNRLIMSDGTEYLYFLDANTYQTIGSIKVTDDTGPVVNLNELEYVNGSVYANIWLSSKIAVINPSSGQVEAYIDLTELAQPYTAKDPNAVLNGIAYNPQTSQLFVTGKFWSSLYEIQLQKTQ